MCFICVDELVVVAAAVLQTAPIMPTVWERVWKIGRRIK